MNTMKKLLPLLLLLLILPPEPASAASEMCTSKSFVIRNWKGNVPEAEPPEPTIPPDEETEPPEPTTPAPTDDVEMLEPEEVDMLEPEDQGEEPLADDEPFPADEEQAIPSVDEDADGQGETNEPDADELPSTEPTTDQVEQSEEAAAVETPADDGEEEITINTEDEPVSEPEDVGEALVDIGGAEGDGEPEREAKPTERARRRLERNRRANNPTKPTHAFPLFQFYS